MREPLKNISVAIIVDKDGGQAEADHKRHIALELALFISEHLIKQGGKYEDVYVALRRYMQENRIYREEKEDSIREENEATAIMHRILAADLEKERKGGVKRDRLSDEEINTVMKWGLESLKSERKYCTGSTSPD